MAGGIANASGFNPYYRWLGIPPVEQPPTLYRLLGLTPLESNLDVIEEAADRQMAHVRTHQGGAFAAASQKLLNELSAAKLTLLDKKRKATYDERLLLAEAPVQRPRPRPSPPPIPKHLPKHLAAPKRAVAAAPIRQAATLANRPIGANHRAGQERSEHRRSEHGRSNSAAWFAATIAIVIAIAVAAIGATVAWRQQQTIALQQQSIEQQQQRTARTEMSKAMTTAPPHAPLQFPFSSGAAARSQPVRSQSLQNSPPVPWRKPALQPPSPKPPSPRTASQIAFQPPPAVPKITYDKSLAPDGKPWTGLSLLKYWKQQRPNLNFTLVKRLELDSAVLKAMASNVENNATENNVAENNAATSAKAPVGRRAKMIAENNRKKAEAAQIADAKRKRNAAAVAAGSAAMKATAAKRSKAAMFVYSETPARTSLLADIQAKFNMQPDRAIIDFAGDRRHAYGDLKNRGHFNDDDPAEHDEDARWQEWYWTDAVEVFDFRGNEKAAESYEISFGRLQQHAGFRSRRWYGIVITGDIAFVEDVWNLLRGGGVHSWDFGDKVVIGPVVSWTLSRSMRQRMGDGHRSVKVDGYPGFAVTR